MTALEDWEKAIELAKDAGVYGWAVMNHDTCTASIESLKVCGNCYWCTPAPGREDGNVCAYVDGEEMDYQGPHVGTFWHCAWPTSHWTEGDYFTPSSWTECE